MIRICIAPALAPRFVLVLHHSSMSSITRDDLIRLEGLTVLEALDNLTIPLPNTIQAPSSIHDSDAVCLGSTIPPRAAVLASIDAAMRSIDIEGGNLSSGVNPQLITGIAVTPSDDVIDACETVLSEAVRTEASLPIGFQDNLRALPYQTLRSIRDEASYYSLLNHIHCLLAFLLYSAASIYTDTFRQRFTDREWLEAVPPLHGIGKTDFMGMTTTLLRRKVIMVLWEFKRDSVLSFTVLSTLYRLCEEGGLVIKTDESSGPTVTAADGTPVDPLIKHLVMQVSCHGHNP